MNELKSFVAAFILGLLLGCFAVGMIVGCNGDAPTHSTPNHQLVSYMASIRSGGTKYGYVDLIGPRMTVELLGVFHKHVAQDTNLVSTNIVIINVVPIY